MTAPSTTVLSDDVILNQIKELVRTVMDPKYYETVDIDNLQPDTHLLSLPLDSLATMELMMGLESQFDVYIPQETAFEFQTLHDVIRYIQEKQTTKAARRAAQEASKD